MCWIHNPNTANLCIIAHLSGLMQLSLQCNTYPRQVQHACDRFAWENAKRCIQKPDILHRAHAFQVLSVTFAANIPKDWRSCVAASGCMTYPSHIPAEGSNRKLFIVTSNVKQLFG